MIDNILKEVQKVIVTGIIELIKTFFDVLGTMSQGVAGDLSASPMGWMGGSAWGYIETVSDTIMLPIAGLILGWLFCLEMINLIDLKNNMHEIEAVAFFKVIMKFGLQAYVLSHALEITAGLLSVGLDAVDKMALLVAPSSPSIATNLASLKSMLDVADIGIVIGIWIMAVICLIIAHAVTMLATITVYGRLLQMVLYSSFAPIPLATLGSQDWDIGKNYIKNLFAITFQGFLIVFILGLYGVIATNYINMDGVSTASDIVGMLFKNCAWGILLGITLLKTHAMTKSIFGAS